MKLESSDLTWKESMKLERYHQVLNLILQKIKHERYKGTKLDITQGKDRKYTVEKLVVDGPKDTK